MRPIIRNKFGRIAVAVVTMLLPWALKRLLLSWLLGYQLDPSSRIGYSIVAAASVRMGKCAQVGHFTVCRDLKELDIADYGLIGNLNWITGNGDKPLLRAHNGNRAETVLRVGAHSAITNRHYVDCSDMIEIGDFTTIAGVRSQFFTHSIDIELCQQRTQPIAIGNYCFVGTGCIILPGSRLPEYSVLAAGSLLRGKLDAPWMIYAGTPAKAIKNIPVDYAYFHRSVGYIEVD